MSIGVLAIVRLRFVNRLLQIKVNRQQCCCCNVGLYVHTLDWECWNFAYLILNDVPRIQTLLPICCIHV